MFFANEQRYRNKKESNELHDLANGRGKTPCRRAGNAPTQAVTLKRKLFGKAPKRVEYRKSLKISIEKFQNLDSRD